MFSSRIIEYLGFPLSFIVNHHHKFGDSYELELDLIGLPAREVWMDLVRKFKLRHILLLRRGGTALQ